MKLHKRQVPIKRLAKNHDHTKDVKVDSSERDNNAYRCNAMIGLKRVVSRRLTNDKWELATNDCDQFTLILFRSR